MSLSESILTDDCLNLLQNQQIKHLLKNPLLKKDVWHTVDDLDLKINQHRKILTLNFKAFSLDWFKLLVKLYILVKAKPGTSAATIYGYVGYLRSFSKFLDEKFVYSPQQIDGQLFEDYSYYLRLNAIASLSHYYGSVYDFFNTCRTENWLNINTYWFIGKRKRNYPRNSEVDYIPEEVWHQLEQNLHYLPEPIQRMVLVIKTIGGRGGEILNLPLNCLRKRGEQWRLRFTTKKYDIDDELPIPPELVVVIQEQQEYIKQEFGNEFDSLFCSNKSGNCSKACPFVPVPKVMALGSFNRWLNRLAKKANICYKDGKLWLFTSHQFRRTIGTIMDNAGIRDLISQIYLRHRHPDMLRSYQHKLKHVLVDEFEELKQGKKYVDITGKIVASHKPQNLVTEYIRRKMYPLTTQYGECHRALLQSPCPTVNACWHC